jgi:mRNA interferase MazF
MAAPLFKRWDIVKVPFPFTEGAGDKRRPALVINNKILMQEHRLYWLLMITSVIKPAYSGDVVIKNGEVTGLVAPSIVRTAKITTLQEDYILGRIGHLATAESRQVIAAMDKWLDW